MHSKLIAGLMAPVMVAMGVAMFINRGMFPAMVGQIAQNFAVVFLSGVLSLVAGVAIVRVHNVWTGWPVLVTVLGWLAIVGGLVRMWFPQQAASMAEAFGGNSATPVVAGLVVLALGAFLSWKAYGPDT